VRDQRQRRLAVPANGGTGRGSGSPGPHPGRAGAPGIDTAAADADMTSVTSRLLIAAVLAATAAGCTAQASRPATARPAPAADSRTTAALLTIATAFNNDYDNGDYGPVYDRWDARSQAIITRADYIRRHTDCPSSPQTARTEDAGPGPGGSWLVDYEISGVQLRDYWFYVRGRWVFDLVLSNPGSVRLYKLTPQQYAAALGCGH
jgi:hypothetical protein